MGIKIEDLMKMEEMSGSYYLAGANGSGRYVESTTVLDAPDGIRFLKGKELVFSTMYPFTHLESELQFVIQDLALRNVSGLGLKLNRYIKELPEQAMKMADKYKFPIIALPPEKSWIDLMLPIMSEILNINNRQLMQSKEVNHQFTKILLSNSTLQQIAELLHHYLDVPVGIFNFTEDYAVFYPSSFKLDKEVLVTHLTSDVTTYEEIDADTNISTLSVDDQRYAVLSFENHLHLKGAILINKTIRKESDDIHTLLHAKNAAILKFIQLHTEREFNRRYKQDFVSRLIVQQIEEAELPVLRRRAWEMGFEVKDKYVLLAIEMKNNNLADIYQVVDEMYQSKIVNQDILIGMDKENHIIILVPLEDETHMTSYMEIIDTFIENH